MYTELKKLILRRAELVLKQKKDDNKTDELQKEIDDVNIQIRALRNEVFQEKINEFYEEKKERRK